MSFLLNWSLLFNQKEIFQSAKHDYLYKFILDKFQSCPNTEFTAEPSTFSLNIHFAVFF